jgi:hypothetical protein
VYRTSLQNIQIFVNLKNFSDFQITAVRIKTIKPQTTQTAIAPLKIIATFRIGSFHSSSGLKGLDVLRGYQKSSGYQNLLQ